MEMPFSQRLHQLLLVVLQNILLSMLQCSQCQKRTFPCNGQGCQSGDADRNQNPMHGSPTLQILQGSLSCVVVRPLGSLSTQYC
uniref:Monoxygenase, putative n=1 Tax=Arundo donax TaxID=35708 RepID=A0A0A9ECA7_ARUDO